MYDPKKHHRRSIRLHGYDYSQPGEYFVTLCTHEMRSLFGRVVDGRMELNIYGRIADEEWRRSTGIRPEIELDDWVVMPSHVHGIIRILDATGTGASPCAPTTHGNKDAGAHGSPPRPPLPQMNRDVGAHGHVPLQRIPPRRPRSLASFVGGVKSAVKIRINEIRNTPRSPVWQRNYHEHIIHNAHELEILRDYIHHNPLRWACDRYNPERGVLVQDVDGGLKNWT